ncbi:MAG: ABC transporter ATP-binding protein, partial [Terrimicrobiaceae bacterium]
ESVNGIRVTQGFVRQDVNADSFRELVADHSRYSLGAGQTSAIFLPLLELNSQFFIAMLLVVGGYRTLNPDIARPVGDIVQFFFLSNLFFEPIKTLGSQYNNALTAMVGAERVFRLLDTKPEWTDAPDAKPLPQITGRVEFRDLSFGYDPAKPVLRGISFTAEPGRTIALVGHTGSGKTSIINLVAKMYLPSSGSLTIDGHDILQVTSDSLHHQMAVVHQQSFLFEGTVLDNIRFARPEATVQMVIETARRLDCMDIIDALPKGLYTQVGEAGAQLSAGQRQLVSFARALMVDPRILILDEATSAIDAMTEARIQRSLATLLQGRTSFVVAHRLSTIRRADLILVLDHGRIAERGTHAELVQAGGIYAGLHAHFTESA